MAAEKNAACGGTIRAGVADADARSRDDALREGIALLEPQAGLRGGGTAIEIEGKRKRPPQAARAARLARAADQHSGAAAFRAGHDIQHQVQTVDQVDIKRPGGPNMTSVRDVRPRAEWQARSCGPR